MSAPAFIDTMRMRNLLNRAGDEFLVGHFAQAELLLAEACVMAAHERRVAEGEVGA